MEALNNAIEGAAAFRDLMRKVESSETAVRIQAQRAVDPEAAAWNAEVDRKRVEKKARKAQHVGALNGLR